MWRTEQSWNYFNFVLMEGELGKQGGLVLTKTLQLCASEQNYYEYVFTNSYKQTLLPLL